MAWLVDDALREHFEGITVTDLAKPNGRMVPAYFRFPDGELESVTYPFITVDLVSMSVSSDYRMRSGNYVHTYPYLPDGVTALNTADNTTGYGTTQLAPQPWNLDYQVTAWSRNPQHDRQLLSYIFTYVMPWQYGSICVAEDTTRRRVDVMNFAKADMLDGNKKRVFRNVWNLRVSTELFIDQLNAITTVWSSVNVVGGPDIGALTPITVSVTPTTH